MNLDISENVFNNLTEIYETGTQSVEVVTRDHRKVQIIASKVLRGPTTAYTADYCQLVDVNVNGRTIRVWMQALYPWAHGDTVEQCIRISSNYLHYSPVNCDESAYLRPLGVETPLLKSDDFQNTALSELENYKKGQPYDLALVCCGLRIFMEKQAYDQLQPTHQSEFLTIFKTIDKLSYAKEKGASLPEVHFLLSIIYNEAMHLDPQCQKLHPIGYKLKNKVIHNMICEAG